MTVGLEVIRRCGTIGRGAKNRLRRWTHRESLVVRLRGDDEVTACGEASPLPGMSPDSVDDCQRALERLDPAAIADFVTALAAAAREGSELPAVALGLEALPAASFALETAAMELVAKRLDRSFAHLLGAGRQRVPVAALIDDLAAVDVVSQVEALLQRGFTTLKFKIGTPRQFDAELETLREIRRAVGPQVNLRVDANGGLVSSDSATASSRRGVELARCLDAIARIEPEFVEEPAPASVMAELASSPVPIALDETLSRVAPDTIEALSPVVQVLVLKPMLLGGVGRCLRLGRLARRLGMRTVASHLLCGPTAHAATSGLALALAAQQAGRSVASEGEGVASEGEGVASEGEGVASGGEGVAPVLAAGLGAHAGLSAWPAVPTPHLQDTWIQDSGIVGLGVDLRTEAPS